MQHLLGVGHLQRALQLARTLSQHRFEVLLVSGGKPQPITEEAGFRLHQLPPLYSPDGSFTRLLDADGNEIDEHWRQRRKNQLLTLFESFAPEVLITETFPFGRRMLRFELLPLLEASRAAAGCRLVISSIRDILQPKTKSERNRETCDTIDTYYDRVLVHGDRRIAPLELSFDLVERIRDKIHYTGYLCAQHPCTAPAGAGNDEVLVSAGGSPTGLAILKTALAARPGCALADLRWRLLVSPAIAEADFVELRRQATSDVRVERNRPDFSELVKRARLSISQAGYNTVTDILSSNTASVVIPYAEADEVEQTLRAQALQRRGRLVAIAQTDLNATTLANAITDALAQNVALEVDLDGADNSVAIIAQWLRQTEKTA